MHCHATSPLDSLSLLALRKNGGLASSLPVCALARSLVCLRAMRDDLTVLVQRIHPRADDFEIFEFFSQAGKVRDIRLIRDQRSNKSKGVGYVEFFDVSSVMQALALNGIAFKGQPLLVQASMAEKNRLAQAAKNVAAASAMMGGSSGSQSATLAVSELPPSDPSMEPPHGAPHGPPL